MFTGIIEEVGAVVALDRGQRDARLVVQGPLVCSDARAGDSIAVSGVCLTVAALGNTVWAGGTGGALYHSVDGGATWNRVGINVEGTAVMESITGIQLSTAQHLTVTAASGAQWASSKSRLTGLTRKKLTVSN